MNFIFILYNNIVLFIIYIIYNLNSIFILFKLQKLKYKVLGIIRLKKKKKYRRTKYIINLL